MWYTIQTTQEFHNSSLVSNKSYVNVYFFVNSKGNTHQFEFNYTPSHEEIQQRIKDLHVETISWESFIKKIL